MPTIPLYAKGEEVARTEVDSVDFVWASQYRWHLNEGYAARGQRRGEDRKPYRMFLHREILGLKHGYPGRLADHIDGDRLNNVRSNLRVVSYSENAHNRKGQKKGKETSAYRGVSWFEPNGQWRVQVTDKGVCAFIGYFDDELDAAWAAYDFYTENVPFANVTAPTRARNEREQPRDVQPVVARAVAAVTDHPSILEEIE